MVIMAEEETDHVKEAPAEFKVRLPYVSPISWRIRCLLR